MVERFTEVHKCSQANFRAEQAARIMDGLWKNCPRSNKNFNGNKTFEYRFYCLQTITNNSLNYQNMCFELVKLSLKTKLLEQASKTLLGKLIDEFNAKLEQNRNI